MSFLLYFLFRLLLFADFETVEYLFHHLFIFQYIVYLDLHGQVLFFSLHIGEAGS